MKLPQLSLRTLFWLLFAAAIGIGWGWERYGLLEQIRTANRRSDMFDPGPADNPSADATARRAILAYLRNLSDAEFLEKKFWLRTDPEGYDNGDDVYLSEMIRRGMEDEIRKVFLDRRPRDRPVNVEALTALRRVQGTQDPIRIDVRFAPTPSADEGLPSSAVIATIVNVDASHDSVDIDGAPSFHYWHMDLRSSDGSGVPASNALRSMNRSGMFQEFDLPFGEETGWVLNVKHYVQAPKSGRYTMQLVFVREAIFEETDLTGLIAWKSPPVEVRVKNDSWPNVRLEWMRFGGIALLTAIVACCMWYFETRSAVRRSHARWLLIYPSMILLLAAGWVTDHYHLRKVVYEGLRYDEVDWTMEPIESSPEK